MLFSKENGQQDGSSRPERQYRRATGGELMPSLALERFQQDRGLTRTNKCYSIFKDCLHAIKVSLSGIFLLESEPRIGPQSFHLVGTTEQTSTIGKEIGQLGRNRLANYQSKVVITRRKDEHICEGVYPYWVDPGQRGRGNAHQPIPAPVLLTLIFPSAGPLTQQADTHRVSLSTYPRRSRTIPSVSSARSSPIQSS